jgi:2,3-dihydroxybiphenyl 1,2-dioxygenase
MAVTQLGYVGIGASDIAVWERFATQVLGLEVSERGADGALYLRMDEYHHRIAVHPGGRDDVAYLGWAVRDAQTLESVAARLQAAGVRIARATEEEKKQRRVSDLIRFEDPNGITLELFSGLLVLQRPFQSPRPIAGFNTGPLGLGHVVLTAKDLGQTTSFYQDLLDFRLSDFVHMNRPGLGQMDLVFFHCNPRHHSVAFTDLPRPKKLSHIMLELNSLDDVGATFYLCQEKGLTITRSLGRHINDRMLSFYMQSPSGFDIEYGWGGRLVDDASWVVQQYTTGSVWGHKPPAG